ncbi:glycosyltransferase family 4 protein [Vibrio sp. LaRot3]|uniref:glycosyltransferase family 4 protein n=1 Tax=Vibrio sp. LaRot3 TaxID=2998829 RepID=UPI0022CE10A0|nr:glycosyltransferase family 4 protein [Vibrio sp. LaRot3]MDA0147609.1 glycosyltransferase family 4 protein [Vibrio sp. LaRot3]
MVKLHHLIFDPIPFKGGSKIATSDALSQCSNGKVSFTVLTVDPSYWSQSGLATQHEVSIVKLSSISWLNRRYQGIGYWLNQALCCVMLLIAILRSPKVNGFIGASGPGIDMPLYLVKWLTNIPVFQFIHGNVAPSRSIGWCLTKADKVFYLPSTKYSIRLALRAYLGKTLRLSDVTAIENSFLTNRNFIQFVNGISIDRWPSQSHSHFPVCFWAASLLKWKGLDLLVNALRYSHQIQPIASHICFIKPQNSAVDVSTAPVVLKHTKWHQDPPNLDEIRAQCNIFISTSHKEPFGLSILEALAAGMCVVIPQDGSYWDGKLTDGVNCVKYQPRDFQSLSRAILTIYKDTIKLKTLRRNALEVAKEYRAEATYSTIASWFENPSSEAVLPTVSTVKDSQ